MMKMLYSICKQVLIIEWSLYVDILTLIDSISKTVL